MTGADAGGNGSAGLAEALAGRYRIVRQLGSGGMATVYLADDVSLGRRVAIKVLKPELAATVALDRFQREIRIAAGLSHPHILPLLDGGKAGEYVYYVMPYVAGDSLRDRLKRGPLSLAEAVRILRDVVDALDHAHSKGVVHRDIKPENVLLSGRHALVTDFGVAKAVSAEADPALTTTGLAVGTPSYMAPEQVLGQVDVDHRADLYATGVVGYEMLTGRIPFARPSAHAVMTAHLSEAPAPLSTSVTLPADLGAAIMKCLEKDASDRWQTSQELLAVLEPFVSGNAAARAPRRSSPRRQRVLFVAIGVGLIGVLAAVAVKRFGGRAAPAGDAVTDRIIVLPFETRSTDAELEGAGNYVAEWVTQGLHREEIGHAVPSATVAQLVRTAQSSGGDGMTPLIDFTHADLIVSGSVSRIRDTVVIQAEIVDARRNQLVQSIDPARAASLGPAVEIARGRILGGIAAFLGFGEPALRQAPPPTVEVFRQFYAGRDAFARGDFSEAEQRFNRVAELDSTYVSHVSLLAGVLYWTGRFADADSLIARTLRRPDRLTPFERASVEHIRAWVDGDVETEYRTAVERGGLDPSLVYSVANSALRSNRPADAMRVFQSVDMESPFARQLVVLWAVPPIALHMLGRHEEEIEYAGRARSLNPEDLSYLNYYAAALAALGRTDELASALDGATGMRAPFEIPPLDTPGWSAILASLELTAHGHGRQAGQFRDRALEWYASRIAASSGHDLRFGQALALYVAGDLAAARSIVSGLLDESPEDVDCMGLMGTIAVRLGDASTAREMEGRLDGQDQPYLYGRDLRWKARMASLRGDTAGALELLRSAYGRGISLSFGQDWNWLHLDPDLDAVRASAQFRTWSAPRDAN